MKGDGDVGSACELELFRRAEVVAHVGRARARNVIRESPLHANLAQAPALEKCSRRVAGREVRSSELLLESGSVAGCNHGGASSVGDAKHPEHGNEATVRIEAEVERASLVTWLTKRVRGDVVARERSAGRLGRAIQLARSCPRVHVGAARDAECEAETRSRGRVGSQQAAVAKALFSHRFRNQRIDRGDDERAAFSEQTSQERTPSRRVQVAAKGDQAYEQQARYRQGPHESAGPARLGRQGGGRHWPTMLALNVASVTGAAKQVAMSLLSTPFSMSAGTTT